MSMTGFDYIRIRGFKATTAGYFEYFQGIGPAGASSELPETPISNDPELADGIWEGQNAKLRSENKYCDQLQTQIKEKQRRIENIWDKFLDVAEELTSDLLSAAAFGLTLGLTDTPQLAWLASILTDVGVKWAFDHLKTLLQRGNELLDGIKDENEKLLQVEKSRENYEYREQVLARHREDIKIILEQIRMTEKQIELNTQLEMKALLERLMDLAMRDDTIEFGDMRLHSRGKVIEF